MTIVNWIQTLGFQSGIDPMDLPSGHSMNGPCREQPSRSRGTFGPHSLGMNKSPFDARFSGESPRRGGAQIAVRVCGPSDALTESGRLNQNA